MAGEPCRWGSDAQQMQVRYATNRSGAWVTEDVGWPLVPFNHFAGGFPSMAVDPHGMVHLAWYAMAEVGSPLEPDVHGRYGVLSRSGDGVDQNCDGVDGVDADGDGRASRESGGDDPDDSSPSR